MIKTLGFHCRGCGFNPWLGNYDPTRCRMQPKKKKRKKEIWNFIKWKDIPCLRLTRQNYFLINFYWSIVALQCCVTFYGTAKWISHTCMYTHAPSWLFSCSGHHPEHYAEFPVLCSMFSLVIHFIHSTSSVYVWIPISQFLPPPSVPLAIHTFVLCVCVSTSPLQIRSSILFSALQANSLPLSY